MKTKHVFSLASLAICAALSASAMAQQTVNFEGRVIADSCTVAVTGGGSGTTVNLDNIDLSTLTNSTMAGRKAFQLSLAGCNPQGGTYQVNFSQSQAINGRLTNTTSDLTDKAQQVSLQILSNASTPQVLTVGNAPDYTPLSTSVDPGIVTTGGSGTGTYFVEYFNEGSATPGKVQASAVVTMNYQ